MEWKDNLSDELKLALKDINSVEDLAKSFVSTKAMQGNAIRMVGPDASAEDKATVYQKVMTHMPELMLKPNPDSAEQMKEFHAMLGVPENTDGYDSGDAKIPADQIAELKQLAVDTNMSKAQFKKYVTRMAEMGAFVSEQQAEALLVANAELKGTWGLAYPDRIKIAERHIIDNGMGQLSDYSANQIEAHYNMAVSLVGKPQAHNQPDPVSTTAPAEAQEQLAELRANPHFTDRLTNPVEHKRLVLKNIELMKAAHPERYA